MYDHLAFGLEFATEKRASEIGVPPGFPLLHWPDGTLCELALCVFDWLHEHRRLKTGTLKKLAFDLREWLAFCLWRGWDPEWPNDACLAAWRAFLLSRGLDAGLAEQKVARVFGMYVNLHRAMPVVGSHGVRASVICVISQAAPAAGAVLAILCDDGPVRPAPGITEAGEGCATDRLTARRVRKGLRWTGAGRKSPPGLPRPIPEERQVRDVLARLRSGVAGEGAAGYPSYLAERDWLMGRAMEGAGCRADEVSHLGLDAILAMLKADGLLPFAVAAPSGGHPLDALAADPAAWRALLDGLERLEAAGRMTMSLPITGKNAKKRLAPVGFDFVRDLLEVGVASARPAQLAAWREAGWRGTPPSELFLSDKTKARLQAGSIGDLLQKAFGSAQGSGHRLRAFYAVMTAIRIFGVCLGRFGGETSPTMVESAHAELAAALGHSSISTTVRFYLDMARVFHRKDINPQQRENALAIIQQEVASAPGRLTDAKLLVLRKTVRALLQAELGSEYMELLDFLPEQADLRRPIAPAS